MPKRMSEAREARKVEAQRSRKHHKGERGRKAMSRAREAQCRGEQAARRKVNSLNPFFSLVFLWQLLRSRQAHSCTCGRFWPVKTFSTSSALTARAKKKFLQES